MEIVSKHGNRDLAEVYVARFRGCDDLLAEFVDARDPDIPPDKKWVIIVSTQFGCPVACPMCDAGSDYKGDLTADEIIAQVDHVISQYPREKMHLAEKFKIQFARMGEPALNPAVLDVLRVLPHRYGAPGLIPCIATIAPRVSGKWFEELFSIRQGVYANTQFQLQFSINSTDDVVRDRLMPLPKMALSEIGEYAKRFAQTGPRKVCLNFALTQDVPVDADIIAEHFDPKYCCVKITPLNPTIRSAENNLATAIEPDAPAQVTNLCSAFAKYGFDVIVSIGDVRENTIGSNCGMAVHKLRQKTNAEPTKPRASYKP